VTASPLPWVSDTPTAAILAVKVGGNIGVIVQ